MTNSNIFKDITAMIEYYRAMGFDALPLTFGGTAINTPGSGSDSDVRLRKLREEIGDCKRCRLSEQRKKIVFGEGNPDARLMFIGEAPGRDEDIKGLPFVGEAGVLLTRLIEKMGLKRSDVYIANIIKCRPPMNRDPGDDEIATCGTFLEKQIGIIRPEVIMTLGRIALRAITGDPGLKITRARGNFLEYKGIPVLPTFHPAYLLRNPKDKWLTWIDAKKVMERLNIGGPDI
ncbi:MAG: uracil-DNA glycosylase [Nitrospirota bacterium]|nr:uracil-DNA glycosylase [Nitrospirota bacterium]